MQSKNRLRSEKHLIVVIVVVVVETPVSLPFLGFTRKSGALGTKSMDSSLEIWLFSCCKNCSSSTTKADDDEDGALTVGFASDGDGLARCVSCSKVFAEPERASLPEVLRSLITRLAIDAISELEIRTVNVDSSKDSTNSGVWDAETDAAVVVAVAVDADMILRFRRYWGVSHQALVDLDALGR